MAAIVDRLQRTSAAVFKYVTSRLQEDMSEVDIAELRGLIEEHYQYTQSAVAGAILSDWGNALRKFHKVMPIEYKKALQKMAASKIAEEVKHG